MFKTSVGTSDEVGFGDCRHVCDDEESRHEDRVEGDHVHETNDDHCSALGTEDCLAMFSLFHCPEIVCIQDCASVFTGSLRCFLLDTVVPPCIGLCSKPIL